MYAVNDSPFAQNEQYTLINDRFDAFCGAILAANINKICFCQRLLVKVDEMTGEWPCRSCCDTQTDSAFYACLLDEQYCVYRKVSGDNFLVCAACYHLDDGPEAKEYEEPSEEKTFLFRKTAVILNVIS